jgi:hypothetical protein
LVSEVLEELCYHPMHQGSYIPLWKELSRYPATLYLYAVGISALKAKNFELMGNLLSKPIANGFGQSQPAVGSLFPDCLVSEKENLRPLHPRSPRHSPLSDWLESRMRMIFAPDSTAGQYNDSFAPVFDQFELIGAVAFQTLMRKQRSHTSVPIGCWKWWRSADGGGLEHLKTDLEKHGVKSSLMQLDIFKNGVAEAQEVLSEVIEFCSKGRSW